MPAQFNSDEFAWKDISVIVGGTTVKGIRGVTYSKSSDNETLYGRGNEPLAIQQGNASYEGTLTLLQRDFEAISAAIRAAFPGKSITDVYLTVPVAYSDGSRVTTDLIKFLKITEFEKGMSQGDKFMEIECPFMALGIEEGV